MPDLAVGARLSSYPMNRAIEDSVREVPVNNFVYAALLPVNNVLAKVIFGEPLPEQIPGSQATVDGLSCFC